MRERLCWAERGLSDVLSSRSGLQGGYIRYRCGLEEDLHTPAWRELLRRFVEKTTGWLIPVATSLSLPLHARRTRSSHLLSAFSASSLRLHTSQSAQHPSTHHTMSSEKALFDQEVSQLEEFQKVSNRTLCTLCPDASLTPATPLRARAPPIPTLRGGQQARDDPSAVPLRYHGQEAVEDSRGESPRRGRRVLDHLRRVSRGCSSCLHTAALSGPISLNETDARLDPVQITQMAKHLETVYVSGWQCSSTASSSLEPGPDLAGETLAIPPPSLSSPFHPFN